ncbi:MAG: DUF4838 domain-containing protein [Bacteroidales bacterium]|nr:DUF4838 domain-containing protein [Bacteroidales bacterium]MDD2323365.1 DUF4838 domain-containing protein [Bacteroidales bacterium]MDD3010914.1 DUF4838 domain-containing protein [Bacteroidales bacterium]MDD3962352.1 DUF4838 domain-containing protein [Bacteroidales bacterium]MDY0286206.1 DUF4838 domain-containing protein [Bacteroidales bacterium]
MSRIFIFFLLVFPVLISCSDNNAITVIKNGQSDYSIILQENATPEELRAANFLSDHLKDISGCAIPIIRMHSSPKKNVIIIATSAPEDWCSGDGFSIHTEEKNLIITGNSQRGAIYGVAWLLETYASVKYLSPEYVILPESPNFILPEIQYNEASPNFYRNINGVFSTNENYKDFHRLHTISDLFADNYFVHTFRYLVPWQEYFETNPEYFAFMNEKRIKDQLCLSNPEVVNITITKLEEEMQHQPDKQVWSVSQNDNFSYCQCEKCAKIIEEEGSPAGPMIRFVNQVANAFPQKTISTLAYQYTRKPPKITVPADNVQVMLCTIELNRSKPISTDSTSQNFLNDLEGWGKISNQLFLWDYTINFAHKYSPFPNLHVLQPNIQLFVKNSIRAHFQQTNTAAGNEFSELKTWIIAKLLWDPNANVALLIEEFTNLYYGSAGKWIRKYIFLLQDEILKTGEWLDIYGPPTNYQNTFLSDSMLKVYSALFDKAEQAVKGETDYLLHVKTARMSLQYAIMEIGKSDMFGPRGWYIEKEDDFIPNKEMTDMLESFYETGKKAKCVSLNESGLTIDDYYLATKRFLAAQVKGNYAFRKAVWANPLPSSKYSQGDLTYLTNGVRGAGDYKVNWLGWESTDFSVDVDLGTPFMASTIEISTLYDPKSWILHPLSICCFVSKDGQIYSLIEKKTVQGNQQEEPITRTFTFNTSGKRYQYVRFDIAGSLRLFDWHPSAGGGSWVFIDEIVVK